MRESALALFALSLATRSARVSPTQCQDDTILEGVGVGGPGAVALLNVTDLAACCTACHGEYHDECGAWIYGKTGAFGNDYMHAGYPLHNCAIMNAPSTQRNVTGHTTGLVKNRPPAPSPQPSSGPPCRADIDCFQTNMSNPSWRCEAASVPSTPQSNCHVAGPGTVGNSTCACATKKCSAGTPPGKDTSRTRYLMIGDSISMGMKGKLAAIVQAAPHNWTLTHNPGNAASANFGAHCVPAWLALDGADSGKWDVISFNFGLHDIAFDIERISVEEYSALMTQIVSDIAAVQKRDGTKVLWVDTTPVPNMPVYGPDCDDVHKCINPPRFDDDVALYNKAARDVIAKANADGADIKTSADLYTFVLDKCGGKGYKSCDIQLPSNVHYTDEGWTVLAAEMAKDLLAL